MSCENMGPITYSMARMDRNSLLHSLIIPLSLRLDRRREQLDRRDRDQLINDRERILQTALTRKRSDTGSDSCRDPSHGKRVNTIT